MFKNLICSLVDYADAKDKTGEWLELNDTSMKHFMISFQICYDPEFSFEDKLKTPVVKELVQLAGKALVALYSCYKLLVEGVASTALPEELTRKVWPALDTYLEKFEAWRKPDQADVLTKFTDILKMIYSCIKRGGAASIIQTFFNQAKSMEDQFRRVSKKEFEKFQRENPRPEHPSSVVVEVVKSKSVLEGVDAGRATDEGIDSNLWLCFQLQAALVPLTPVDLEVLCLACEGRSDYPIFKEVDEEQARWRIRVNRELESKAVPRTKIAACVRNIQALLDGKFNWDNSQREGKAAIDTLCEKLNTSRDFPMDDFRALYQRLRDYVLRIYGHNPHLLARFKRCFDDADALKE